MARQPYYRILKPKPGQSLRDAPDLTKIFAPYMGRVQLHDRAGGKSDAVTLEFADDGSIPLPPHGQKLALELGYKGETPRARTHLSVDQYASNGAPATIRMSATSADFTSEMRAKRERTHQPTTLGNLLAILAEPYGVTPVVKPDSLANLQLPLIDQAGKSDLGMAVELADTYGGIFKPGNGKWIILGYDAMPAPQLAIDRSEVAEWSGHFQARKHYPTVIAHYHDLHLAKRVAVQAGSGEKPITRLDKTFATKQIALAHATARLNKGIRQARRLRLRMEGRPELQTMTLVTLTGFRKELNRAWLITDVTHTIDKGGYRCEVEAEGIADDPTA
ncbi:phage late control D family protein [Salinisphaera hydrothermalis]|uniref:phage late control D family protein n=1 Tax=Salinisphaera hydrothermalis TaxID=563188 RepID=UPI00333E1F57